MSIATFTCIRTIMTPLTNSSAPFSAKVSPVCVVSRTAPHRPGGRLCPVSATLPEAPTPLPARFPYPSSTYQWRGFRINYHVTGPEDAPTVLLVHGFGASSRHWRANVPVLASSYRVVSIDLLGFGLSEKPGDQGFAFSSEAWRDLLLDFIRDTVGGPVTLVGNSIGSLACLLAAAEAEAAGVRVRGVAVLNTAGAMNNKGISDDWRLKLAAPLFALIDWLLAQPRIARTLFDRVREPGNIRDVLKSVYVNHDAIDDDLIELICSPAEDKGALETFVSIISGPPGPRCQDLSHPMPSPSLSPTVSPDALAQSPSGPTFPSSDPVHPRLPRSPIDKIRDGTIRVPLLLLWGDRDPFTPIDGPVGKYFRALPETRPDTVFTIVPDCGHCPHDDNPKAVHAHLLPWLEQLHT